MTNYVNCNIIIIVTVVISKQEVIMTSLELAKEFEASFNYAVESQKNRIKREFEKSILSISANIPSYLSKYDNDDFNIDVAISLPFSCLDCVKEWAYKYFEEMDNVDVESILSSNSSPTGTEITKIKLKIYV